MAADSVKTAKAAPFVEKLTSRDLEILYLTEPIDEVAVSNIGKYKDFALEDVSKENLELAGEEKEAPKEEVEAKYKSLTEFMKGVLEDKVNMCGLHLCSTFGGGWSSSIHYIAESLTRLEIPPINDLVVVGVCFILSFEIK